MDAQPKEWQAETHAINGVGIDLAGPFYMKEGRIIAKTYVSEMIAKSFLKALYCCILVEEDRLLGKRTIFEL
ncbi:hypothetical protein T4A_1994 [Trichinella pseudospiralis]|uniref:Uncharacterized protein n=1 Tax=Trichinella pseudospiralis TaxID=6337 RepID=A0A0V1DZP1_TRIPS|nr:hypothetical protein T4A_1994 [Trichinella pseudospiralis]